MHTVVRRSGLTRSPPAKSTREGASVGLASLDRLLPGLTGLIARTAHEKNRKRLEERATANRLRPDWSES